MIEMIEFSTTPRNSELKLSQGLLESAKKRLLGQNPPEKGVVLVKNVSFESYVKFCEAENNLPIKTRLINGNVVAYESALSSHGTAAATLPPTSLFDQEISLHLELIYPVRTHYPGRKPMVAMLYQRSGQTPNIPTRMISFGNAPLDNRVVNYFLGIGVNVTGVGILGAPPCNTPNIPTYQLQIPAAEIFNRTPFILPTINFDLICGKSKTEYLDLRINK
ncbi:hypothetical protein GLOIN_2v1715383 [Rhizophagus irregularis DAOM 181602=DAOM 197198]|nr:hypothetical protein GLOIN_2v1715383 [Rhizophagus irregularis DAOM 181602=DAOM 197198]